MKQRAFSIFLLLFLLFLNTASAKNVTPEKQPEQKSNKPVTGPLNQLKWLSGYWTGKDGTEEMEELWTTPANGMMVGLHRDIKGVKTFFEYLRIEENNGKVQYIASPMGKASTSFDSTEISDTKVVFENQTHDFPKKIIYSKNSTDSIKVRIEGTQSNKVEFIEWIWFKSKFH